MPGGTITCSIQGQPFTTYTIEIFSSPIVLGTITTNAAGFGSGTFVIPASLPPGTHTIEAIGAAGNVAAAITVQVGVAGAALPTAPSSASTSLPFTGANIGITAGAGAALIGGGGMLLLTVRKRRRKNWQD